MKKFVVIFFVVLIGLSSCKKDSSTDSTSATNKLARDYLYSAMNEYYYWYNLMPAVNKDDYADPYTLLDAMMYKTLDKWSFVETYDEYVAETTGSFVGHGISMGLDADNNVRIAQIYKNSPMYSLGVRRGWIVKKLNGTELAPIFIAKDGTAYNNLIGASTAGIKNTFLFQTPEGKDSTIATTKATFTLNTVIAADTLHLKSGVTGHLVFDQFISISNDEFLTAFAYFNQNNIKDLILDLRYNGGGDLSVLTNLASYIAGAAQANSTFLRLTFNELNTDNNTLYKFKTVTYPLSITKLVIICSKSTASASEDLINGLKPFFDITCIGDTTAGKPVGMIGIPYQSYYMFWPIAFSIVNSKSEGDFYSGFAPAKYVADDVTHDWSDRKEACLKQAIGYLENGTFSSKGLSVYKPSVVFPENHSKINNAYFIKK
jgi:carboxyl-terminal processing protease